MEDVISTPERSTDALTVVDRYNRAFERKNVEALMELMTEDCVFDSMRPSHGAECVVGHDAVRRYWESFFRASPNARFEVEEQFGCGDRCVVRWRYSWIRDGRRDLVRGVDVFRVEDGRIAEKLSYATG